ncbi:TMhelix containing protein [Vibrio phage 2.275.O._10N.286.54.E11]|nr:TMhelix containing protein [Vibrio phage 2.275.O._10N.286.54.E11]
MKYFVMYLLICIISTLCVDVIHGKELFSTINEITVLIGKLLFIIVVWVLSDPIYDMPV